jgi:neutral ceramidase
MDDKLIFAGAGREIITPEIGTLLFGYRPDIVSESVNDNLTATAVMFSDGETRTVLISLEICEIANELSDELRKAVGDAVGVPSENIILSATHTHSGPITVEIPGWGEINRDFCDNILIPKTVGAALTAMNTLKPAKLGIGTVQSDIGVNRRQLNRDGSVSLGQNPWGMYDPTLTVLSFKCLDNAPIVNIIHYGCHGTASGCNREITRDWSGPMIDRLEEQSGCLTVFFNGAQGDIGPRLSNGQTTGNIKYAMGLGAKAGIDAVRAYTSIKEYRTCVPLKVITGDISMPYKPLPPLEEVEKALEGYAECDTDKLVNLDRLEYHHLTAVEVYLKSKEPSKATFTFRQTIVVFGPVVIIPFPFEIFVEVALRLKEYSGYAHTLCLSNANGANAYFPSQDQLCRGGYEVREFLSGGTFCLTDDADNIIINANLNLLEG